MIILKMKKVAVYTCLVGNYDSLKQPEVVNEQYDYICFSNDIKETNSGVWEIRKIPFACEDKRRLSRYAKLLPHKVLPDYEYSLYMDANLQITGEGIYDCVKMCVESESLIWQVEHLAPPMDCLYEDIKEAYAQGRVAFVDAWKQLKHLQKEGFPRHYGMFENNLILRRHNNPLVMKISEEWWDEYMNYSQRDQFSLMYIYWKNNFMPDLLLGKGLDTWNCGFIKRQGHHSKPITPVERIRQAFFYRKCKLLSHLLNPGG